MRKLGGAATRMQLNSNGIDYLIGDEEILNKMRMCRCVPPFSEERIKFLNLVSKILFSDKDARQYPDVITFAFWCRKSSLEKLKERFVGNKTEIRLGRGVAFHIAPSNVAVNYAYSFVAGFLAGNANVVRLPSREFPQVMLVNAAIKKALEEMPEMVSNICLIKYKRQKAINDMLSSIADVRIIWGGDTTIQEIRKSELKPRATEVTFADRYSLCVIDAEAYLATENEGRMAEAFYNDTYLTDQNACSSPRIILWMGRERECAKERFWSALYEKVKEKYRYQSIQGINKLTSLCLLAIGQENVRKIETQDNSLVRVQVGNLTEDLMKHRDNSGFFLEYDLDQIEEMQPLCSERVQTVAYIGKKEMFYPLIERGVQGIDRIVPVGKTMDFDLIWDGYNLMEHLSRQIQVI